MSGSRKPLSALARLNVRGRAWTAAIDRDKATESKSLRERFGGDGPKVNGGGSLWWDQGDAQTWYGKGRRCFQGRRQAVDAGAKAGGMPIPTGG